MEDRYYQGMDSGNVWKVHNDLFDHISKLRQQYLKKLEELNVRKSTTDIIDIIEVTNIRKDIKIHASEIIPGMKIDVNNLHMYTQNLFSGMDLYKSFAKNDYSINVYRQEYNAEWTKLASNIGKTWRGSK